MTSRTLFTTEDAKSEIKVSSCVPFLPSFLWRLSLHCRVGEHFYAGEPLRFSLTSSPAGIARGHMHSACGNTAERPRCGFFSLVHSAAEFDLGYLSTNFYSIYETVF